MPDAPRKPKPDAPNADKKPIILTTLTAGQTELLLKRYSPERGLTVHAADPCRL